MANLGEAAGHISERERQTGTNRTPSSNKAKIFEPGLPRSQLSLCRFFPLILSISRALHWLTVLYCCPPFTFRIIVVTRYIDVPLACCSAATRPSLSDHRPFTDHT